MITVRYLIPLFVSSALFACGSSEEGDSPSTTPTGNGSTTGAAGATSSPGAASSSGGNSPAASTNAGAPSASTPRPGNSNGPVPSGMGSTSAAAPMSTMAPAAGCPATAPEDDGTCDPTVATDACTYGETTCNCFGGFGMGGFGMAAADAGDPAESTWNCRVQQPAPECPATAPTDGDTCTGFISCEYDATTCACTGMGGGMGGGGMTARTWNCGDGTVPMVPSGSPMMPVASAPAMPSMMPMPEMPADAGAP